MIYFIIGICILYTTILSIPYAVDMYYKKKHSISFAESVDLAGYPIATFYIGDKKLNFLFDTGSNCSIINEDLLKEIPFESVDGSGTLLGMDGKIRDISYVELSLYLKKKKFVDVFQVTNLNPAFDKIKQNQGITLHGILGTEFFVKYKYILDFKELIAYAKK